MSCQDLASTGVPTIQDFRPFGNLSGGPGVESLETIRTAA
jgi:hypothetical protein